MNIQTTGSSANFKGAIYFKLEYLNLNMMHNCLHMNVTVNE